LSRIRPAAVAGQFYPGDAAQLAATVDQLLATTPHSGLSRPKGLLVPHAGYIYSGSTAASAYAALRPYAAEIRRVVLLGPSHRLPLAGLALPSANGFQTPLGTIPIDPDAAELLADLPQVSIDDEAHAREHSLEVHLPFLQRVLDAFVLVPLVVGHAEATTVGAVIERLWGGEETLIVVSSDLSHFLAYENAQQLDRSTCHHILGFDDHLQPEQACGAYPINGFMLAAAEHGLTPELLKLCNSGDTAGDHKRVVGYAAFAFIQGGHHVG
jgi:MEMO1 family protein